MFRNLIDGSENAVWHLLLEDEIPQNYENRSNVSLLTGFGNR